MLINNFKPVGCVSAPVSNLSQPRSFAMAHRCFANTGAAKREKIGMCLTERSEPNAVTSTRKISPRRGRVGDNAIAAKVLSRRIASGR